MKKKYQTVREYLTDPSHTQPEKEKMLVEWIFNYIKGMGTDSTVHYSCGDVDEWAVPLSLLDHIKKEIFEGMEWKS
jgi:hypothetical protein